MKVHFYIDCIRNLPKRIEKNPRNDQLCNNGRKTYQDGEAILGFGVHAS